MDIKTAFYALLVGEARENVVFDPRIQTGKEVQGCGITREGNQLFSEFGVLLTVSNKSKSVASVGLECIIKRSECPQVGKNTRRPKKIQPTSTN